MQRITTRDLENLLARINEVSGYGPNPPHGTVGAYTLAGAYGGWKLEQYTQGGGHRNITSGYVPKRELHTTMQAFLRGLTISHPLDAYIKEQVPQRAALDKLAGGNVAELCEQITETTEA